jgi:uncharacterized protein YneF (UPF0154 family)
MGAVFRPTDLGRGNRKIIENAVKDFSPDTKDNIIKLLDSWEEKPSGEKLKQILGQNKAEELLKNIVEKEDVNMSQAEQMRLRNTFRDSLMSD